MPVSWLPVPRLLRTGLPGRCRARVALLRDRARRLHDDDGFTLIEVIVSFVVFAVVAAGASTAIYKAVSASRLSQQRTAAAGVAQYWIANAIAQANKNTAAPEAGRSVMSGVGAGDATAAREEFTVVRTVTFDSGDTCSPGTLFTVNVVVSQRQTSQFLARSDTKIACPPA